MLHLRRYFAALALLSLLCGTYWAAAAPWIAPPRLAPPRAIEATSPVAPSPHVQEDRARLFPAGSWELDPATKVVETDNCTLLIRDYLPTPDGRLQLNPCTLIFYSKTAAGRRPIVMQAPAGAELKFDKALDVTKATFGRLIDGKLKDEITISSPPTQPGGRDALWIKTCNVQLDRDKIVTNYAVDFQFGESRGRGSGLKIILQQPELGPDGKKKKSGLFGGMQSLTLNRLEFMRIVTEGQGLLGETLPNAKPGAAAGGEPIEVKCGGPFTFDVASQVARFVHKVEVLRILPNQPPDKLLCDELLLTFLLRAPEGAARLPVTAPPAGGKSADPLAGRLQRILALGRPATLEAPASGVSASAAWMEFDLARRRITLRPDNPQTQPQVVTSVSLRQHEQHFTARELQYEIPPAGRLGAMWAAGPGEVRLLQGRGAAKQMITARWEKELWVRPQEQNQVISLIAAASVIAEPLGRFDADELHLWVLEVPAQPEQPMAEKVGEQTPEKPTDKQPRMTLVPHRLLAKGHVQLTSPKLDAQTGELQAWFINLPTEPGQTPAGPGQPAPGGVLREPVAPAAFQQNVTPGGTIKNIIRPPSLQKFRAAGEMIQMQLVIKGRQFDLEDLMIDGQAQIDETRTPEPGQEPIHVAGDLLKLRHGTSPEATIEVSGHPAEVGGRGMLLMGGLINVHRGENRLWIDGPGEATLPAPAEQSLAIGSHLAPRDEAPRTRSATMPKGLVTRSVTATGQKLHLVWQQKLNFDGSVIRLDGDVQARTATQTVTAKSLEATLNRRIDFLMPANREKAELAKVRLDGGVFLTNRGLNDLGEQVSFEQMQVPNLTVDRLTGLLHADGPGWVSTVRRSAGLPGAPGAPASNQQNPAPPPLMPPGAARPTAEQPLTSVHIAFHRALDGDLDKREIQFKEEVRTTYSPAQDFSDRIIVVNVADLTERAVLMTCDLLTVTEFITPVERWVEIQATGRTILQGTKFLVNTPGRLSYTSATEIVTIEGDGRAAARIYWQAAPGEPVSPTEVTKARYNVRTNELLSSSEVKHLDIFIPSKLKLPGRPR